MSVPFASDCKTLASGSRDSAGVRTPAGGSGRPEELARLWDVGKLRETKERVERFDKDPHWDSFHNRSAVPKPRTVRQDFGYSRTNHAGGEVGEIGGFLSPAAEPAYYAKKIPLHTFADPLSASGRLACTGGRFHALIGLFNAETLNEWRTPNTIVLRIAGRGDVFYAWVEYATSRWRAGGDEPKGFPTRLDPKSKRQVPIGFTGKGAVHRWSLRYDPKGNDGGGVVTATIDDQTAVCHVRKDHGDDGATFNRFGLLNVMKSADDGGEVWIDDLTINGRKEDFTKDPGWDGLHNRRVYETRNVRPRFDFGYSPTHFAGGRDKGELGGLIFRGDCRYPERMAYYGDRLDALTLAKPLRASGKVSLRRGVTDSTVLLGFFHSRDSMTVNPSQDSGLPRNFLGISTDGPSREGFYFSPAYRLNGSEQAHALDKKPPSIYPDGKVHDWTLAYSPTAAGGRGRITLTLDDKSVALDLRKGHKEAGAHFDRFGLITTWVDGNGQHIYFDDLTYTCAQDRPGSDWPMYRRDPALTAVSPLRGGLAEAPQRAWSIDLGGPKVPAERVVVRDVTGDGQDEFLTLSADTVTCRDSRGRVLWTLAHFLNANVVDVRDFVGDGSRGILLTTFLAGKLDTYMVCGRTGKATHLWRDENNFGGQTRIGRLLPGVPGVQVAAAASGATPPAPQGGPVRLVSFEEGLDRPHFRVRHHVTGVFYAPLILFADLDGDGTPEMVVISHEQIWAFDPRTGKPTFHAAYAPSIRTYSATVAAIKLRPQDACPALVMINPHLPGLRAVRQDGKTFARELWKVVVGGKEDQYQKRVTIAPAGPGLVYDLENDGRFQVLASIKNEHGDGNAHLVVFEARTGKRLAELPDAEVLAVDDLDGDGKPEVLFRRGNELHIARWKSSAFHSVYQGRDVSPVLRPLPSEGDVRLAGPGGLPSRGNRTVWREKAGSPRFLLRFPDGIRGCRLGPAGLEKGHRLTRHEALNNLPAGPRPPERVVWDGSKLVTLRDGREVYRYVPPAPTTYLAPPPLVVDLAGKRRILVRDAAGNYLLISEAGRKDRVLLERPYETSHILADAFGVGPLVCDMNGDGDNDVVATVTDARGRPACVVLDGHGKEKRRFELLPGMTALSRGPTGRLGPGRGRWLLLRMSGEGTHHEQRQLVVAYDGRTGKQLWVRDHYGRYGQNPVVFVPHFPSAVLDYDGDGADDWVVCSENFYGIVSVKDNKDLVGPVVLSDALPGHWTAYTFPSLAPPRGDGRPVVFHHNAYALALVTDLAGKPLWHFGLTRDTAGTWGQFVDLDGDGEREVLHAQPDGVLRCFPLGSSGRCPTCPADAPPARNQESRQRWQLDLGRPISRMIAADLRGDGRMAVLFGGADGKLHALGERDGKPRLLWSVLLGRRVGEPVLADLDGNGRPAILVTAEDGRLYCFKGKGNSE